MNLTSSETKTIFKVIDNLASLQVLSEGTPTETGGPVFLSKADHQKLPILMPPFFSRSTSDNLKSLLSMIASEEFLEFMFDILSCWFFPFSNWFSVRFL